MWWYRRAVGGLDNENRRLLAQVAELSGPGDLEREAAPWRDATPEERLAAVVGLCEAVPGLRELWPPEVASCAEAPEPVPQDTLRILELLRASSLQ